MIDNVLVFSRQMGIVIPRAGSSLACLGQVLLKDLLSGLARLRPFRNGVLR
ncbi:hypothetical protein ACVIHH_000082 [Bradyrhizobium sp. USDA 4518]